jgi:uncharacterized protein YneF (UPF0154 family)
MRKVPNEDLYYIVNKETKQKFSKTPLDSETAKSQMKALYAQEGLKFKEKKINPRKSRFEKGSEEAKARMAAVRAAKNKE